MYYKWRRTVFGDIFQIDQIDVYGYAALLIRSSGSRPFLPEVDPDFSFPRSSSSTSQLHVYEKKLVYFCKFFRKTVYFLFITK
jgi:hypothetical protein